jgi:hypothetical protein
VQVVPRIVLARVLQFRKTARKPLHGTPDYRIP